ncbi:hypothetical protein [Paenibacillus sp. IITD108]|uniref:hypothetical protein n=1 Tax=Paenibacillus sp. IITD108 TaxID=3116649 RepID=UPI002F42FEE6
MNTAILANGDVVRAEEYSSELHGHRLLCMDKNCNVPLIYVPKTETRSAHFKTTGKIDSKHSTQCGFYEPLSVLQAIKKVSEYQEDFLSKGIKETIIRLNMNRLDPDYSARTIEKNPKDEESEQEVKTKETNPQPSNISSVKTITKLMTSYDPDMLASIIINVGGGRKVPLSSIIVSQDIAHNMLWSDQTFNIGYFVFGTISKIKRLEKVIYIDFEPVNEKTFTLVVFEKYFKHFTYKDEDLINYEVIAYGMLKKNEHNEMKKTEMLIKSNKYIEKIKRRN